MTVAELHSGCCSSVEMKMLFVYVTNCPLKCVFPEELSSLSIRGSTPTSTKRKTWPSPILRGAGKPYS